MKKKEEIIMKNDNEQDNEISNTFLVFLLFVNKLKTFYYCRYEFHYIFLYYVYHWHLALGIRYKMPVQN